MSGEEYSRILRDTLRIAKRLREGRYTMRALEEAMEKEV